MCCSLGPWTPCAAAVQQGIRLNKDWTEKSQCSTTLHALGSTAEALQWEYKELGRSWSRLSMIWHNDFQKQTGKMLSVYSEEKIREAMEKKVEKMLKEVFTGSSHSSCLYNTVVVFPPFSSHQRKKKKKGKSTRKFPTTGWSSCAFLRITLEGN